MAESTETNSISQRRAALERMNPRSSSLGVNERRRGLKHQEVKGSNFEMRKDFFTKKSESMSRRVGGSSTENRGRCEKIESPNPASRKINELKKVKKDPERPPRSRDSSRDALKDDVTSAQKASWEKLEKERRRGEIMMRKAKLEEERIALQRLREERTRESASDDVVIIEATPRKTSTTKSMEMEKKNQKGSSPVAFVGFANLPHQVHRKSVKKGFEFTLMVAGESGLGKSTLVNSLFLTDLYSDRDVSMLEAETKKTILVKEQSVDIEEKGVKLRLTIVDTPGFGDSLDCTDCFQPIIKHIDTKFEEYLKQERGFNRRHLTDNRVHALFYFISPSAHGLKPLDVEFLKSVHHKVNIIPVVAKADMLTGNELKILKMKILEEISDHQINIYQLPEADEDEDEDFKNQTNYLKSGIPFAVVGSNKVIEVKGRKIRGRMYPWGVVEVENPDHSDFLKLRTMLVTHMQDLQEVTHDCHYELFRRQSLQFGDLDREESLTVIDDKVSQSVLEAKDAELRRMQQMLQQMQLQMQQQAANENNNSGQIRPRASKNIISKNV